MRENWPGIQLMSVGREWDGGERERVRVMKNGEENVGWMIMGAKNVFWNDIVLRF